jgi:chaperonin cofactor prefoldin
MENRKSRNREFPKKGLEEAVKTLPAKEKSIDARIKKVQPELNLNFNGLSMIIKRDRSKLLA